MSHGITRTVVRRETQEIEPNSDGGFLVSGVEDTELAFSGVYRCECGDVFKSTEEAADHLRAVEEKVVA